MQAQAGVALIVGGTAATLVIVFWFRARLSGPIVDGMLAASGVSVAVGGLLVQTHASVTDWILAPLALAVLFPAHVRVLLGGDGPLRTSDGYADRRLDSVPLWLILRGRPPLIENTTDQEQEQVRGEAAAPEPEPVTDDSTSPEPIVAEGTTADRASAEPTIVDSAPAEPMTAAPIPPVAAAPYISTAPRGGGARIGGRGLRTRVELRKVGPWSVLKFSLIFYFCVMLIVWVALVIIYLILSAAGAVDSFAKLLGYLFANGPSSTRGPTPVRIDGVQVFTYLFVAGCVLTVVWSLINVFIAFIYNLISDVIGGIEVTLADRNR